MGTHTGPTSYWVEEVGGVTHDHLCYIFIASSGIGVRAGGIPCIPAPAPPTPSLPATPINLLPYNGRPLSPKTTPSFVETTRMLSSSICLISDSAYINFCDFI